MTQPQNTRLVTAVAATAVLAIVAAVGAQKISPADIAAKLSGNWKLNLELSSGVGGPGRGRAGGGAAGGAAFALAGGALPGQRGGGGGRGGRGGGESSMPGDLPPDVVAAQAAIRDLQQIPESLAVKAAADTITFIDPRGERTFAIDNKTARLEVNGARVEVKSRWVKSALRQEFMTAQTRLIRSWEADEQGHLVLKARIESMTTNSKEVKAVYDKQ